jgi:hypothetical protein
MSTGSSEFEEIGHCGGQVTFRVVTGEDGRRAYQIMYQGIGGHAALFAIYALGSLHSDSFLLLGILLAVPFGEQIVHDRPFDWAPPFYPLKASLCPSLNFELLRITVRDLPQPSFVTRRPIQRNIPE